MIELIKITERDGEKVVSARELYTFLESKREFATWIKDRINQYGFIENQDYTVLKYDYLGNLLNDRLDKNVKSDNKRIAKTEYALSMDMAKELSMVECNEKGKQARRYFIECEKALKTKNFTKEKPINQEKKDVINRKRKKEADVLDEVNDIFNFINNPRKYLAKFGS